jgi:hypothetical protein
VILGVEAGTTVVSDGGQWFRCIAEQPGIVTGSDRRAARHPAFRWANTVLANAGYFRRAAIAKTRTTMVSSPSIPIPHIITPPVM